MKTLKSYPEEIYETLMKFEVIGITGLPIIREKDSLSTLFIEAAEKQGTPLQEGDIIVASHVIVSRAEGRTVDLDEVTPSKIAENIAEYTNKDPRLVEVVLQESRAVRRMAPGVLITETLQGFICANAGVDKSNVPGGSIVAPLPEDGDASARRIREEIRERAGVDVAVIVCDTHGRPFRMGEVNVTIGVSGLDPIRDRRGEKDLFGYELKVKQTAIADELASAAELIIGQADEGVPAAIIRGYKYQRDDDATSRRLIRPIDKDLFI